jgi:uncharacterized phage protein gp47/JayE
MTYGVTRTGFNKKTLEIIVKENVESIIARDGDINTDPNSVIMNFLSSFAFTQSQTWEMGEAIFNSIFPDTAFGVALDSICSYIKLKRLQATKTTTLAKLTGKNQILIPANSQVIADNVNTIFLLTKDESLTNESCYEIYLDVKDIVEDSFEYYVFINNEKFSYTKYGVETLEEIVNQLVFFINQSNQPVEASNLNNQLFIKSTDVKLTMYVYVSQYISIDKLSVLSTFVASDAGYISLAINSLVNIQTPVAGWISVINEFSPEIGRDLETDDQLRIRRKLSLGSIGSGTLDAIRAKLLNLTGVTSVLIIENATDATVNNIPPHSFEPLVSGGDDLTIAQTIWDNKGAGIQSYGNLSVPVKDSSGTDHVVKFSRPIFLYIYVDVSITKDVNLFPVNGDDLIKGNLVSQISKLSVGESVLYQSLFRSIFNVSGVTFAEIKIGGSLIEQKPDLVSQNIIVQKSQVQKTDISKITIL